MAPRNACFLIDSMGLRLDRSLAGVPNVRQILETNALDQKYRDITLGGRQSPSAKKLFDDIRELAGGDPDLGADPSMLP